MLSTDSCWAKICKLKLKFNFLTKQTKCRAIENIESMLHYANDLCDEIKKVIIDIDKVRLLSHAFISTGHERKYVDRVINLYELSKKEGDRYHM